MKYTGVNVQNCPSCGEPVLSHRICPSCGKYHDRQVLEKKGA
jgi:large subunit ribosomal protein L32